VIAGLSEALAVALLPVVSGALLPEANELAKIGAF
jgi:hypothetical protein